MGGGQAVPRQLSDGVLSPGAGIDVVGLSASALQPNVFQRDLFTVCFSLTLFVARKALCFGGEGRTRVRPNVTEATKPGIQFMVHINQRSSR